MACWVSNPFVFEAVASRNGANGLFRLGKDFPMAYSSFCEETLVGMLTPASPTTPRLSCEGLAPTVRLCPTELYTPYVRPLSWPGRSLGHGRYRGNTEEEGGEGRKEKGEGGRRDMTQRLAHYFVLRTSTMPNHPYFHGYGEASVQLTGDCRILPGDGIPRGL